MNLNVIRTITVRARPEGVQETAAALKGLTAAQEGIAKSSVSMATVTDMATRSQLSMAEAFNRLERRFNATIRQQQDYEKVQRQVNAAVQQNPTLQDRANELMRAAALQYGQAGNAARAYATATSAVSGQLVAMAAGAGPLGVLLASLGPAGLAAAVGLRAIEAALTAAIQAAGKFADDMGRVRDAARVIGLGTLQLQAINDAGSAFALTEDKIATALERFTVQAEEARRADGELFQQLQRIDPQLALRFARTRDTADALEVYSAALDKASTAERAALARAGLGRTSIDVAQLLQQITRSGGIDRLTEQFRRSGDAIDHEMIERVRHLKREIDDMAGDAERNFASIFSVGLLEREYQFYEGWRGISRLAREFSVSPQWEMFVEALKLLISAVPGGALITTLGSIGGGKVALPKLDVAEMRKALGMPAETPATFAERFGLPNDRAAQEADINLLKQRISVLGTAATIQDRYNLKIKESVLAARDAGASDAERGRIIASLNLEQQIEIESRRLGLLGPLASIEQTIAQREREIAQARMQGVAITRAESDAIIGLTRAQAEWGRLNDQASIGVFNLGEAVKGASDQLKAWTSGPAPLIDPNDPQQMAAAVAVLTERVQNLNRAAQDANPIFRAFHDASSTALDAFLSDLQSGKDLLTSFLDAMASLTKKFAALGLDQLMRQLAGGASIDLNFSAGGGIFGASPAQFQGIVAGGFKTGVVEAAKSLDDLAVARAVPGSLRGGTGLSAGNALGGLLAIGSIAGTYQMGAQAGSPTLGALSGGLSGGLAGLGAAGALGLAAGPLGIAGLVAGAALGYFGGQAAQRQQEEAQQQQNRQAWEGMKEQYQQFVDTLNGTSRGSLSQALIEADHQLEKFTETAKRAGESTAEAEAAFARFKERQISEFRDTFAGFAAAFETGFGADSPYVKAVEQVRNLATQLKGFISDANAAAVGADMARKATIDYALSLLGAPPALSKVESAMLAIQGTAAALGRVLGDLGLSADEAGQAIRQGVARAFADLRQGFLQDIQSGAYSALGMGYLNDLNQLIATTREQRRDALSLGVDPSLIDRYFAIQAQKIVTDANLVGASFDRLIDIFPDLSGVVHAATVGTTNLTQAYQNSRQQLTQTVAALQAANDNIRKFREGLLVGQLTTLSPAERLAEAQRQFQAVAARALAGDQGAMGDLTGAAQTYLDQARDFYATTQDYAAIFNDVQSTLSQVESNNQTQIDQATRALDYAAQQTGLLESVNSSMLTVADQVAALNAATVGFAQQSAGFDALQAQLLAELANNNAVANRIAQTVPVTVAPAIAPSTPAPAVSDHSTIGGLLSLSGYANGGIIGNGRWGMDSVIARYAGGGDVMLAGGEYVSRAGSVNGATLPWLDFMNRTGRAPANDDNGALIAEIRGLRRENQALIGALIRVASGNSEAAQAVAREVSGLRTDVAQNERKMSLRASAA